MPEAVDYGALISNGIVEKRVRKVSFVPMEKLSVQRNVLQKQHDAEKE